MLNSEFEGERSYISLYGFTEILPGRITTDKIISADGQTYFDLAQSEIGGKIKFLAGLISGDIGIGNDNGVNAGMSGAGNEDEDIRIWAGETAENRENAPFRVMHDGKVVATDTEITGKIIADEGRIGGFKIVGGGIVNSDFDSTEAYVIFRYDPAGIFAGIGKNILPSTLGLRGVARFENHENQAFGFERNIALYLSAKNGAKNDAIYMANGWISGFALNAIQIDNAANNMTLGHEHCWISCYNTNDIDLNLPAPTSAQKGKVYYIRRMNAANIRLVGKIMRDVEDTSTWTGGGLGDVVMLVNDGQFWCYNHMGR
jgi:hypothetical protein